MSCLQDSDWEVKFSMAKAQTKKQKKSAMIPLSPTSAGVARVHRGDSLEAGPDYDAGARSLVELTKTKY